MVLDKRDPALPGCLCRCRYALVVAFGSGKPATCAGRLGVAELGWSRPVFFFFLRSSLFSTTQSTSHVEVASTCLKRLLGHIMGLWSLDCRQVAYPQTSTSSHRLLLCARVYYVLASDMTVMSQGY